MSSVSGNASIVAPVGGEAVQGTGSDGTAGFVIGRGVLCAWQSNWAGIWLAFWRLYLEMPSNSHN
jgi:hypothetical protein